MIRLRGLYATLLALLLAVPAWAGQESQQLPAEPGCLITDSDRIPLQVEVAHTPEQRQIGLMGRDRLEPGEAMLFRYPQRQDPERGFWMYQTRIALDIAWLDADGVILGTDTMVPCTADSPHDCPVYPAGVPFRGALEVPAGFFDDNNVNIGDMFIMHPAHHNPCCSNTRDILK